MQQILAETVLGTNHTKYSRNKYLNKLKKEHSHVEIVNINNIYSYIIPDELLSMDDLAVSSYLTEALQQEIQNVLNSTGNLRTDYRNAIIGIYQQYYEFVLFSNNKGDNRKLLLGNKYKKRIEKFDSRKLGNRRLPYSELGAYLIIKKLNDFNNTSTSKTEYTFVDENNIEHYIFTRFEWYKMIISNSNLLARKFENHNLSTNIFTANDWVRINESYMYAKKSFYNSRLGSFLNRCNKAYALNDKERIVAYTNDDAELYSELGYPLSDNLIVLNDSTCSDIIKYQNYLCKKFDISSHYYGMIGRDKSAKKYQYEMRNFLNDNYDIKYTWIALSIQRHPIIDIPEEIKDSISNMEVSDNISNEIKTLIETDWNKSLINKIKNYKKNSYKYDLPHSYYDTILTYISFNYLDEFYSLNTFNKKQIKYILNIHFKEDYANITLPDELLDIGVTEDEVIKQLELEQLRYFEEINSFSKLDLIYELLNKE